MIRRPEGALGELVEIDDTNGRLRLLRGPRLGPIPLPEAVVSGGPLEDRTQREAVLRVAESIRADDGRYPALLAILGRARPSIRGLAAGGRVQSTDLSEMKALALGLDASYLFLQGPPGTGKTWTGARIVVHLLAHGRRIGIAAQSHKAIHNLLTEIEKVARSGGVRFKGSRSHPPRTRNPNTPANSSRATPTMRRSRARVLTFSSLPAPLGCFHEWTWTVLWTIS